MVASFNDRFEVTWHDPADATAIWANDRIHFAQPVAPLGEDIYEAVVREAWEARTTFANGYLFMKDFRPPPTPAEVTEMGAQRIWHEKYLPLVRQLCGQIQGAAYDAMTASEIVAILPSVFQKSGLAFRYPTVITSTFMAPALQMAAFCQQVIGDEGPVLAATLLQGYDNESAAAGKGLGDLAAAASQHEQLSDALKAHRFDELVGLPDGAEFTARLEEFLATYGWRAEEWCLVHRPTWAEQPSIALDLIARYLSDPGRSPMQAHERALEKRHAAAERINTLLPEESKPRFQEMLSAALGHVTISEERALWQLIAIGSVRVPVLALGRKLLESGAIDNANDVFFLRLAELEGLTRQPHPVQEMVTQRKTDLERYERLEPPQSIGAPLIVEDRPGPSQIIHRFFFGTIAPPSDEHVVRGSGASQGIVTARARIVRSLAESTNLEPGEVLVCRTTAPPWTPLFAVAAAVVTDIGGILSHSAICAREYGIPCVVGTQVATTRIPDGAIVTVDGNKGTVTIDLRP